MDGTPVHIAGAVVTNVKSVGNTKSFFVQDPTVQSWGGILIFTGTNVPTVAPGAIVDATGSFKTFRGTDEVDVSSGTYRQTGTAVVPAPLDVAISDINENGTRTAELQSMLVRVKDVTATSATSGFEFPVQGTTNPGPSLNISSFFANDSGPSPFPATQGQVFVSITGNGFMNAPGTQTPIGKLAPGRASDVIPK